MMLHRMSALVVAPLALAVIVFAGPVSPAAAAPAKTLDNLMAAYNGESNANAKYLEFAKKADQEGYTGAAALFRAAARAEEFHARNHAEVIRKLGGTPKADVKLPEIKTTAENLKAAIEGETYEKTKMYPEFIAEAKTSGQRDALRSFNFAISAEGEHAALYTAASNDLQGWKAGKKFYVCPICGKTVERPDFSKCPVCFTPAEKYLAIA